MSEDAPAPAELADVPAAKGEGCPLWYEDLIVKTLSTEEVILGPVTGHIPGGSMCALMGPSGAGKTTLLRALSRIDQSEVAVGGSLSEIPEGVTAFVTQDDKINPLSTARGSVAFYARLRMPSGTSKAEIDKRVEAALDKVGLLDKADQKVGGPFGFKTVVGMSGGERRRVSIACGIVTSPAVLFLDEPTTGLDASTALSIGKVLSDLATKDGTTIVCTIHQPRQELFALFDKCVMLHKGNKVYDGPAVSLAGHFEALGNVKKEAGMPGADFAVDYMSAAPDDKREAAVAAQRKNDDLLDITEEMKGTAYLAELATSDRVARQPTYVDVYKVLLRTVIVDKFFSPDWFMMTLLKTIQVLPFINNHTDRKVQSEALMGLLMLVTTTTAIAAFQMLAGFRAVGESYAEGGVCTLSQYLIAIMCGDFLMAYLSTFLMQGLFSLISFTTFSLVDWLYGYLVLVLSWTFSFLVGYVALGIFTVPIQALLFNNVTVFVFFMFSGFLRPKGDMEFGLGHVYEVNPIYWAYQMLIKTQTEAYVDDETATYAKPIWMLAAGITLQAVLAQSLIAMGFFKKLDRLVRGASADASAAEAAEEDTPLLSGADGAGNGTFDAQLKPVAEREAVISWKDLKYTVRTKEGEKRVLHGVSGQIVEGTVCAIMGSSGAGKTTLLRILSGSITAQDDQIIEGTMTKVPASKLGFVMQDAVVRPYMKTEEMVRFYGRLKLPTARQGELNDLIHDALDKVSLVDKKQTLVGGMEAVTTVQGLSGGQRRRVAIACAIVSQPEALMLDEPTSGLDSAVAHSICTMLASIAKSGVTVGMSIHQPRLEVFKTFDQLVMMSEGMIVYDGPAMEAPAFFGSVFEPNLDINPADYIIDCSVSGGISGEDLSAKFYASDYAKQITERPQKDMGEEEGSSDSFAADGKQFEGRPGFLSRFWVIFEVEAKVTVRSSATYIKVLSFAMLGALIGLVDAQVFHKSVTPENVPVINRALVFNLSFSTFFLMFSNMYNMSALRSYMSECTSGLYKGLEAWMALQLSDLILSFFAITLYFIAFAWPSGLLMHAETSIIFYVANVVLTLYFALFIMAVLPFAPPSMPMDFLTFQPPMLSLLYGGVWFPQKYVFRAFRWMQYISPTKYTFNAIMQSVYGSMDFHSCYEAPCDMCAMCIKQEKIFQPLKAETWDVRSNMLIMIVFVAFAALLSSYSVTHCINKNKYWVDVLLGPGKFKPPM